MIPDAEALIGTYLREHPDVAALDARVAGSVPASTAQPWVRVLQLDAADSRTSSIEHLIDYLLQLDVYAGKDAMESHVGQREASTLARTVRQTLHAAQGQTLDGVVISSVTFTGMARVPDPDFNPARERYVLTVAIHAHA